MAQTINIEITDNSEEVLEALKNAIERCADSIGESVEGWAKMNITEQGAIDTGNLRNSITYSTEKGDDGVTTTVGTAVEYAPYIEFGTGKYSSTGGGTYKESWVYMDDFGQFHRAFPQRPRPFLEPAVSEHTDAIQQLVIDSLENA
jgi:HK97 gp10 family phage protein